MQVDKIVFTARGEVAGGYMHKPTLRHLRAVGANVTFLVHDRDCSDEAAAGIFVRTL